MNPNSYQRQDKKDKRKFENLFLGCLAISLSAEAWLGAMANASVLLAELSEEKRD
jgi:hypothetical protein